MQIEDLKNERDEACATKVIFFFPMNTIFNAYCSNFPFHKYKLRGC